MHGGGVEVLHLERQRGEVAVALGEPRVEVDEPLVLGERRAGVAALAQQRGIAEPGLGMLLVEPEHRAELDLGPLGVALGEIGERPLVVGFGPLGGAVAGGERGDEREAGERTGEAAHGDSGRTGGRARAS